MKLSFDLGKISLVEDTEDLTNEKSVPYPEDEESEAESK